MRGHHFFRPSMMLATIASWLLDDDGGEVDPNLPPGSPPTCKWSSAYFGDHETDLFFCRQVRRTMVHYSGNLGHQHWNGVLSCLLLLSNEMAHSFCSSHQTQRSVQSVLTVEFLKTKPHRIFATRGTRPPGILWLDFTNTQSIGVHCPANSWLGCGCGSTLR